MATQPQTIYLEDDPTPLTATQLSNGEIIISHAPVTTSPVVTEQLGGLLDGEILGVDKKLIALGLLAWLVLKNENKEDARY